MKNHGMVAGEINKEQCDKWKIKIKNQQNMEK